MAPTSGDRSYEAIRDADLRRLCALAATDRDEFLCRNAAANAHARGRLLAVALCQGAAMHFLDGTTGVKDFDVWNFFVEVPGWCYPPRRRRIVDFGDSRFGVTKDSPQFIGRRVDLLGRSLAGAVPADPVGSIRRYLLSGTTTSARCLAMKAVVLLEPIEMLGTVVWPVPTSI